MDTTADTKGSLKPVSQAGYDLTRLDYTKLIKVKKRIIEINYGSIIPIPRHRLAHKFLAPDC